MYGIGIFPLFQHKHSIFVQIAVIDRSIINTKGIQHALFPSELVVTVLQGFLFLLKFFHHKQVLPQTSDMAAY